MIEMMRNWWVPLAWTLAMIAMPTSADAKPVHRIVAVGDLHGDFAAWRAIARAAGLEDAAGRWSGGSTVLVQTGDVVDRGPDSLKIVLDLMRLQREAARAGGRVVALVGNHEAMNVTDDLRYVSAGDYAAFTDSGSGALRDRAFAANKSAIEADYHRRDPKMGEAAIHAAWIAATPLGQIEHQAAWHPDGRIGRWIAGNPAVALIDGTLFVHGGISTKFARLPIAEINRRVDAALIARDAVPEAIINDPDGPLWNRHFAIAPSSDTPASPIGAELDQVLKAYGAHRIVIAHTPILGGIAILFGGRLIRIDTGISAVFGGTPDYLEIIDDVAVPHVVARP